jgi:[CysO sulfur-carrier protein]-S-L-cysteine hydrolase
MLLPAELRDEMINHARECAPAEACGLLAGVDSVEELIRIENIDSNPYRYEMDPSALFRAFRSFDRRGMELLGIYHSHPTTPAYPSPTDIRLAFYPESLYLVVTLQDRNKPEVRAFSIVEGVVTEQQLDIGT